MRFIDGILPPHTIKTGAVVSDGQAYFNLGNFVAVIRPKHDSALVLLNWTLEAANE